MRLFIAIPIPLDVALAASRALPTLPALRPVAPELMHVTLAFIGSVPPSSLDDVAAAARAGTPVEPFDVVLDRIGRFPSDGAPSVVWLGIAGGASQLEALAAWLRRELAARRVPFDEKPFRAHVTLARVRERAAREEVRAVSEALARVHLDPLAFRAEGIVVMESALSSKGPRYTAHATVPFEPRAPRSRSA